MNEATLSAQPLAETTVSEYLRVLSELTLSTEVTDGHGTTLSLDEGASRAVQMILTVGAASRKVMLVGNGGSAAIVSHVQNDICKAVGVRAMVFTEQPLLTALANDNGYVSVYEQPVKLWAEAGDLLLAVSSSGQSENILRAVSASTERNCGVITLSGFKPENPLRRQGDINFYVRSEFYGYVENAHRALTHFMTDRAMMLARAAKSADAGA